MNPDHDPSALYLVAVRTIAQLGCLLTAIAGGALVLGLVLDRLLGTKPIILLALLLGSIPVSLWVIYRYTLYQTQQIQTPPTKKEDTE